MPLAGGYRIRPYSMLLCACRGGRTSPAPKQRLLFTKKQNPHSYSDVGVRVEILNFISPHARFRSRGVPPTGAKYRLHRCWRRGRARPAPKQCLLFTKNKIPTRTPMLETSRTSPAPKQRLLFTKNKIPTRTPMSETSGDFNFHRSSHAGTVQGRAPG